MVMCCEQALSYHISQKDAEEKARAWANVAMVSCVADPHESEARCATNKPWEWNWYLSNDRSAASVVGSNKYTQS